MRKTIQLSSLFLLLLLTLIACEEEDDTSTDFEPLTQQEQDLVGTWLHTETEGGIDPGPVDYGTFRWTFNSDRTGEYYQNPDGAPEQTSTWYWRIDSADNIIFMDENGMGDPQYRIDETQPNLMRWYNYTLGDTYVVERQ